jgi:hypothetical protein
MKRTLPLLTGIVGVVGLSFLSACGGGGGSSLPAECKKNSPLQISSPGLPALDGEFTPTDTVIFPGKIVPGAEIFGKTPEELEALESEAIGTAFRVIVADFPIKENQIMGGFNSGVISPETGGTNLYFSVYPIRPGEMQVGDVIGATESSPYLADVSSSVGANLSMYVDTTLDENYFLGGATDQYAGGVTVLAFDEKNLCLSVDYTIPELSSDSGALFTVKGVISGSIEKYASGDIAG